MKLNQVLETYDQNYADAYDSAFLTDKHSASKTADEIGVLKSLFGQLGQDARWLDLACGTGYYLSCFPSISRTGIDLSDSMLAKARQKNPCIPLHQGNFRDATLTEPGSWNLITSMWWAYSMAESMEQIDTLISNIHLWLSAEGICFLPICNPSINLYAGKTELPYIAFEDAPAYGGRILVTGVTWSWIQPNGKRHENMLVPQMEVMVDMFKRHFASVELIEYTPGFYWGILASKNMRSFDEIKESLRTASPAIRRSSWRDALVRISRKVRFSFGSRSDH